MIKIASSSVMLLIFLSLFVPTTYIEIKIVFLFVSISAISILILNKVLPINLHTLYACFMLSLFGLFNSFHGLYNDNPGAIRVLSVMAVWPFFYVVLSVVANQNKAIIYFTKVLLFSLSCIVFYSFLFLGYESGIVPEYLYIVIDQGQIIGFKNGFVEYNLYSISSLLFLFPFLVHYTVNEFYYNKFFSINLFLLLILAALLVFLTGRRAVLLVLMLTPIMIFSSNFVLDIRLKKEIKINLKRKIYLFLGVVFGSAVFVYFLLKTNFIFDNFLDMFLDGFDFEEGDSSSERTLQYDSLINGWANANVLFGVGNGGATELVRSNEFPWAYELTYVYLLFSTGIVGVLFYFSWFFWGLLRVKTALSKNLNIAIYTAPLITGVFGMGLGAASNPYFGKFDYLWVVMLPHLIAGALKYQKRLF